MAEFSKVLGRYVGDRTAFIPEHTTENIEQALRTHQGKYGADFVFAFPLTAISKKDFNKIMEETSIKEQHIKSQELPIDEEKEKISVLQEETRKKIEGAKKPVPKTFICRKLDMHNGLNYMFGVDRDDRETTDTKLVIEVSQSCILAVIGMTNAEYVSFMTAPLLYEIYQTIRAKSSEFNDGNVYGIGEQYEELKKN